jgi:hypothetical protein
MAASKAGDITIGVQADFARFRDDFTKLGGTVKQGVGDIQNSLQGIGQGLEAAKNAFEGFLAALAVEKIVDFVKSVTESAQQMQAAAQVAGLSTTAYQELILAGEHVGITHEQMSQGLDKFTKSIGLAADGNKKTAEAFKALGVSVLYADGTIRPTEDILTQVASALAAIASPAERAREEVALFGRAGQELAPLLNEGGDGIAKLREEVEKLGLVMDADTIQALANTQVKIDELNQHWKIFSAHLIDVLNPAIRATIDLMNDMLTITSEHVTRTAVETRQMDLLNRAIKAQEETLADDLKKANDPGWMQSLQFWKDWPAIIAADRAELKKLQDQLDALGVSMPGAGVPGASLHPMHGGHATTGAPVETATGSAAAKSAVDQATKDFEKEAKAIGSVEEALQRETAQASMNTEQIRLDNALRQANVGIRSAAGQQIAGEVDALNTALALKAENNKLDEDAKKLKEAIQSPQAKYNELIDEYNKLLETGRIDQAQYNAGVAAAAKAVQDADPAIKQATADQKELQTAIEDAAGSLLNDLGRAFTDSGTAADRWKNLLSHAIQDVMSAFDSLIKKLAGSAISSLFGGAAGTTLGDLFGGGSSAIVGPLAGSPMVLASGGHMGVGDWAVVGEAGPELVYADTPGNVLSASRTRGVFGSSGEQGGNIAYIDARGADAAAVARMEKALQVMNYSFEHRALAAVSNERKRGGAFAAAFNR